MPLIVQSTKQTTTSFNLSIIKSHMQTATNNKATLAETKVAIVSMYQNGTTAKLSPQAQKAAHALAQYIHKHKTRQKFAFVLGKDHQGQQLLLLTIANHLAKTKANTSLRRGINHAPTSTQKQVVISSVKQLRWVTKALHKAEFGILFWIYQHRLSGQEAIAGTSTVPAPIIVVNFQRVKTPHEQLQDDAWTKMMQVVQNLTSSQLGIRANAQQLPSQTKITASHIMLAIQKIIISDDEISKAAQKLMKAANIEVQLDDKTGAMMITIQNYGHDKIITIFGFKATATPLAIAQAKIDAAQYGVSLPTKLNEVFHDQTPRASDVHVPTKNGVTFRFKSATAINNQGESILTYEVDVDPQVDGAIPKDVSFVVSGFETQAQAANKLAQLAQATIQKLEADDFTTGINKTKIASIGKPLKADVIRDIKKQINDQAVQDLILPSDITITADNMAQTITIVIVNHGSSKTITILGFRAIKDYLDLALIAIPSSGGSLEIPEGITSIQFDAYVNAMGVISSMDKVGYVTTINKFAEQYKSKITSLTIPSSFTTIDAWFKDFDKITSLSIPNSVTTIGTRAFPNARLTSLHIPNSVTTIGDFAFINSPLTTLSLGNQLKTIGVSAFENARLGLLIIPNSVTSIGVHAFLLSPLTTLSLGNQLKTIGASAFFSAKLTSLIIPDSVTSIGNHAFRNSPLTNVKVFNDVKLHEDAFKDGVTINRISKPTS